MKCFKFFFKIVGFAFLIHIHADFLNTPSKGFDPIFDTLNKHYQGQSIFLEVGSCEGTGIRRALVCGFESIYSIESNQMKYNKLQTKFHRNFDKNLKNRVKLYLGTSTKVLKELLLTIEEPTVFWLDARVDGHFATKNNCFILQELEIIKNHPIKNHTIFINGIRGFQGREQNSILMIDLFEKLYQINPAYEFFLEPGSATQDIFIAKVPL